MSMNPRVLIERQVNRVRRRLFLQKLLESLVLFWAGAFLLCAAWFVVRPFVAPPEDWARWWVPAGITLAATLAGIVWAFLGRPHFVTASLALDEQFGLKERVTTFTMLSAEQTQTPAGQALLDDVRARVQDLDVPSRFPVRVRWQAGVMPLCTALLAVAASFFNPSFSSGNNQGKQTQALNAVNAKEIQQQIDNLRKVHSEKKDELEKSKELKELEAEWEKLMNKPLDPKNKEQVRERANELSKLEEKIQKRINELKDEKAGKEDMKKLLNQLLEDKLSKKLSEGPAKDLEDALAKGKFDKARDILEKLRKDLQEGKLNKEDMKKLGEQMKELENKLKRLMDKEQREKALKEKFKDDPEKLKQALEKLDREFEDLKDNLPDLKDLADALGECKECLGAGNALKAGEALKGALEKLKALDLNENELQQLINEAQLLEAARMFMLGQCECDGDPMMNGLGQGKKPGGVRPIGDEPKNSKIVNAQQKGEVDPLGQQKVTGFVQGGTFKKIAAKDVGGAFQQAVQEAPDAIERQRIPSDAEAQVRGYFQKLGNQK